MTSIDLNADLGEIPGDLALMESVSSANVACGGHAGDCASMREAMERAGDLGIAVGAHPGYLDRDGFGRTERHEPATTVAAQVREQVERLMELGPVRYVKLHGALYHRANADPEMAEALLEVLPVHHFLSQEGVLLAGARAKGFGWTLEGFCDRAYRKDGTLVDRREPGAVLEDADAVAEQACRLARSGGVGSLCLHGDTSGAAALAARVRKELEANGIEIRPFA